MAAAFPFSTGDTLGVSSHCPVLPGGKVPGENQKLGLKLGAQMGAYSPVSPLSAPQDSRKVSNGQAGLQVCFGDALGATSGLMANWLDPY